MSNRAIVTPHDDNAYWRVVIGGTKGNILDRAAMTALAGIFREAAEARTLKAICLEGDGAHFSFGASVQEHLPDQVEDMLAAFHELMDALFDSQVIVLAAVRGQCLGGAMELVTLCHRVFAGRDATFAQPEIALGVFAPLASIALPERIGRAHAEDLCLTGRSVSAVEAREMGLVDEAIDGDPWPAALEWARKHLGPKSAASLRFAVRAIRAGFVDRIRRDLPRAERLYLTEMMRTHDAVEGLHAFLEKRRPDWKHQ
jgi:cyclohexa-1,5-dienecarbonyl-CoA hydratase